MQLKALIATLVVGSSSIAAADTIVRDHRTPTTFSTTPTRPAPVQQIRGDRRPISHRLDARLAARLDIRPLPPVYVQPLTWVTLANNTQINGRALIKVQPSSRQYTRLAVRADGKGKTQIDEVMIMFGNGTRQIVDVDAKLSKKNASLSIDLKGDSRTIERIVLVGKSNGRNATVDILAL